MQLNVGNGPLGAGMIVPEKIHFLGKSWEKGPVCAGLVVTHFVDDRLEVHPDLTSVPHRLLFTGGLGQHAPAFEGRTRFVSCTSGQTRSAS